MEHGSGRGIEVPWPLGCCLDRVCGGVDDRQLAIRVDVA